MTAWPPTSSRRPSTRRASSRSWSKRRSAARRTARRALASYRWTWRRRPSWPRSTTQPGSGSRSSRPRRSGSWPRSTGLPASRRKRGPTRHERLPLPGERCSRRGRGVGHAAPARRPSRRSRPDRDEGGLRGRGMRRLLGAIGWPGCRLLPAEPPIDVPAHLFEAYERLAAQPPPVPIAGGTDIMVRITGELGEVPLRMLNLSRVEELKGITLDSSGLVLGAATTYTEIRRSALCLAHLPALVEAAATIGAAQIQNRGRLAGNIANASPASDTLPILLAADARILVGGQRGEREIPAAEFFTGYRQTALAADELILHVTFPLPPGREIRFRKVGTRRAQAISKVVLALAWRGGAPSFGWSDV